MYIIPPLGTHSAYFFFALYVGVYTCVPVCIYNLSAGLALILSGAIRVR